MPAPPRYTPPSSVPDPSSPLYAPWLLQQLRQLSDDQAAAGNASGSAIIRQERVEVPAGSQHRVSPSTGGMVAILEAPGPGNFGKVSTLIIEAPVGELRVVASPHVGADGKIAASLINDAVTATFTLPGVVSFTSNGVDGWKTPAQTPTETPATGSAIETEAALDAEYVLSAAHPSLASARVATDSTEISVDRTVAAVVSWALRTASVAFSKLANLTGLSVLGRAANSSGVMAAITATAARQTLVSDAAGTAIGWENLEPTDFNVTETGTLTDYVLPAGMRPGDTLAMTLTGNVTLNSIVPPFGVSRNFWFFLNLRDQSGGSAPGWSLTIPDIGTFSAGRAFRTPGQPQGGAAVPYVMQSEEEGAVLTYSGFVSSEIWRIIAGTAGQAVTGDVVIAAGNGGTRTAAIGTGVIVDADVNAAAAIAQTKLGATTGFSVKASGASATTSAEPIVTFTASANMSAERVTTSTASIAVDIVTAAQIQFKRAALTGDVTAAADSNATTLANAIVTPTHLAVEASSRGAVFELRALFAAGVSAAADDVAIFSANAPFAFRILRVIPVVTTAVALATWQARNATGGGGAAVSSTFDASLVSDAPAITANNGASATIAANGTLVIRRSLDTTAGEVVLLCVRS